MKSPFIERVLSSYRPVTSKVVFESKFLVRASTKKAPAKPTKKS